MRVFAGGLLGWAAVAALGPALLPGAAGAQAMAGPEETARIQAALPDHAPARPLKPRRLLIFDLNVIYGGHGSIPTANTAFTLMGKKTGAFETVVSRDPAVFSAESLKTFDAVFFNNTVGNQFTDPTLRRNLLEFVLGGGGLMGVHGTTVGFTRWDQGAADDWPEWGCMLGGRGANHRAADEAVLVRNEDPLHPVTAMLGHDFRAADEFFRFSPPYSRERVRVLLSLDNARSAALQGIDRLPRIREDEDYAVAWVRNYGRGRVFYSSMAHNPKVFWDPAMLKFYLAAAQFALGDLPAPTVPSAKLTPAIRAQEKLGWRLGVEAYTFSRYTLFEAIEKTAALGLPYMGGLSVQKVGGGIDKNFEPGLSDEELQQVRMKLDAAGIRMLTYYIQDIPGDEAGCRKVFEFGKKMGVEVFMAEPALAALPTIDRFCNEYGIKVGLHNHDQKASPNTWCADAVLKTCQGRSKMIGAAADVGYWMRSGLDCIAGVRKLGDRLITLQMHDLNEITPDGHDVAWGSGAGKSEALILELRRLGVKPVMFGIEHAYNWTTSMPEIAQTIRFFDGLALRTAKP
ncbi:MAG: ThuA domain-containing protein [Armatimonadetes bacterium]|nr:ThuA domain-containing protein [Armatimonadota bacterium]